MSFPSVLEQSIVQADGHPALLVQHCDSCRATAFPVSSICPRCGGKNLHTEPLSATGTVFSWTVIHRGGKGMRVPYIVALADFPEGPRIFSQVAALPEQMKSGMNVRIVFGTPPAGAPADSYYFEKSET